MSRSDKPPTPAERRAAQRMLRLDGDLLDSAKVICAHRGLTLTDYFALSMRPIIARDVARLADELKGSRR